jgi:hypothetical protein
MNWSLRWSRWLFGLEIESWKIGPKPLVRCWDVRLYLGPLWVGFQRIPE